MDFKSKYYRELKNRLTNEELEVVKYLQHNRSQEKLKAKKENNLEVNSSRGRKKKQTDTVPSDENIQQNEQPSVEENSLARGATTHLIQVDTRATSELFSNLLYHVQRVVLLILFLFVYLISYKQE
jgi:hypothetical protein